MKFSVIIVGMFFVSNSMAGTYKEVEFCQYGRVMKCVVGPYAHECEDTAKSCTSVFENLRCIDARATIFPTCNAGMIRMFAQDDCKRNYEVARTFCVER